MESAHRGATGGYAFVIRRIYSWSISIPCTCLVDMPTCIENDSLPGVGVAGRKKYSKMCVEVLTLSWTFISTGRGTIELVAVRRLDDHREWTS